MGENMSGGSSKSSSSSSNTTVNTDKRLAVDNGSFGISSDYGNVTASGFNSKVEITDGGLAKASIDAGLAGYQDLLKLTQDTFSSVFDVATHQTAAVDHITQTTTEAIQKANAAATAATDTNRYLVAGGLAVVGIVAIKIWGK